MNLDMRCLDGICGSAGHTVQQLAAVQWLKGSACMDELLLWLTLLKADEIAFHKIWTCPLLLDQAD
jgi:hypothetical protein